MFVFLRLTTKKGLLKFHLTKICPIFKTQPILTQLCTKCYKCVDELACPAISKIGDDVVIDSNMCFGCVACAQICPEKAIKAKKEDGE